MALEAMTWQLNRKANTLANPLSAQGAANVWNLSSGLSLVLALNQKAGVSGQPLQKVLNTLAATQDLGVDAAARAIP